MKSCEILIVDDDAGFRDGVRLVLEAEGYKVVTASAGAEGLKVASQHRPDLIILDVMMDYDTEGFDVCRTLATDKNFSMIPIVMVTGINREMNLPFAFEPDAELLPARKVVEKPVDPRKLVELVGTLLGRNNLKSTQQEAPVGKKALIIDDDNSYIESTRAVLLSIGYEVATANSGKTGFQAAQASHPDVILLDVMMESDGAGLDTVRKLLEDPGTRTIPVILETGVHKPEFLLESYAPKETFPNVVAVLEKPVPPDVLIKKLNAIA